MEQILFPIEEDAGVSGFLGRVQCSPKNFRIPFTRATIERGKRVMRVGPGVACTSQPI